MKVKPAVPVFRRKTVCKRARPASHLCSAEQHGSESQSDLDSRWTPALACLCGIFRPPPGVVGSRSFPTLRWNTDFSGYKNLWNFSASKQLCVVWCTCHQSFWGRIVVFPRINMFSGQNSAASLRTGRPNIEIYVETEVDGNDCLASTKPLCYLFKILVFFFWISFDWIACFQDKTGRPNIEMFVETEVDHCLLW